MPTTVEAPTNAKEMHAGIFSDETIQLPPSLTFFLASLLKNKELNETEDAQPLLAEVEDEVAVIQDAVEEQTIARTLLLRFGLPYLPGAEEVWVIISEYLKKAKEATEKAKAQLEQSIQQIQALLITQLTTDQEDQLEALEVEEDQHHQGITTLQKTDGELANESQISSQKDGAIAQKKERLFVISAQKRQIQDSITSMRAMISNLIWGFAGIQRFDSTQLVMA